jgi:RNA polymerase sigma-70 factor (ECF subfamily)
VTTRTAAAAAGAETTSAPDEWQRANGRPVPEARDEAAAARTRALFHEYGRTVAVICRALLRDRTEAEDAAQQTFLSAHRALLAGTEPREPAAWLAAIARNECRARIRARMREPLASDVVGAVAAADDPVTDAIRRADLAALWAAIEALPRQQREALVLRELGGLSYDELADALTVSGAAVESLLFRARRRLRRTLRAAVASLTGLPWLESLAGGSAPVAAKVAVLGAGAAALTGGVVGPAALDDRHPPRPVTEAALPPTRPMHVVQRALRDVAQVRVKAPAAPAIQVVSRVRAVTDLERHVRHEGEQRDQHPGTPAVVTSHTEREPTVASGDTGSGSSGRDGGGRSDTRGSDDGAAALAPTTVTVSTAVTAGAVQGPGDGSSDGGTSGDGGGPGVGGSGD